MLLPAGGRLLLQECRSLPLPQNACSPAERPDGSYTARLLDDPALVGAKVREEADEVARAVAGESVERVAEEAADLLYHLEVVLASRGLGIEAPATVLNARRRDG